MFIKDEWILEIELNITKVYKFAEEAHKNQKRKYTDEPYIIHPRNVALLVLEHCEWSYDMIYGALLHDVVEDCDVSLSDIQKYFGNEVARIVDGLTDTENTVERNREKRKEIDRIRLSKCDYKIQSIKLADLIDNSHSIIKYDENFAKVYIKEKNLLLNVLNRGDKTLFKIAQEIITDYYFRRLK